MNIKFEMTDVTKKHMIIAAIVALAIVAVAYFALRPDPEERPKTMEEISQQIREEQLQALKEKEDRRIAAEKQPGRYIVSPASTLMVYANKDLMHRKVLKALNQHPNMDNMTDADWARVRAARAKAEQWIEEQGELANADWEKSDSKGTFGEDRKRFMNELLQPYYRAWDAKILELMDSVKDVYVSNVIPQSLDKK